MPVEPPTIGPRIPFGSTLRNLVSQGEAVGVIDIAREAMLVRPAPFYEEPLEQGVAMFPAEYQVPARRRAMAGSEVRSSESEPKAPGPPSKKAPTPAQRSLILATAS